MQGISVPRAAKTQIVSKTEAYVLLERGVFIHPGDCEICYDDASCTDYRRAAYGSIRPGSWLTPHCQDCREGKYREEALCVRRPIPRYCLWPGCDVEIGDEKENISGYCRKHVQKIKVKRKNTSKKYAIPPVEQVAY